MKKRTRKLSCLLLVAMLVVSMTLPAMATKVIKFQGTGTENGYPYSVCVFHYDDYGVAYIEAAGTPTTYSAKARSRIYDDLNNKYGYTTEATGTGYARASAQTDNAFFYNGYWLRGVVINAYGKLYVGNKQVVSTYPSGLG